MDDRRFFVFSKIDPASTDKAYLIIFKIKDKIIDKNFIIPCHGSKISTESFPDNFEIQIWFPKSITEIKDENKILSVPDWYVKELDARLIKPSNFKFEMLFMYFKKLWYYGETIPVIKNKDEGLEDGNFTYKEAIEKENVITDADYNSEDKQIGSVDELFVKDAAEAIFNKEDEKILGGVNLDYDSEDEQLDQLNKVGITKKKSTDKPRKKGCSSC